MSIDDPDDHLIITSILKIQFKIHIMDSLVRQENQPFVWTVFNFISEEIKAALIIFLPMFYVVLFETLHE